MAQAHACENAGSCWQLILGDVDRNRGLIEEIKSLAGKNPAPARITFGTSGWRGVTGEEFTFRNLGIVTAAVITALKTVDPAVRAALGTVDFEEVRRRGVVVGHDNRLLGPEFSRHVMGLLRAEGIRVFYAGESTTPEMSAAIDRIGAACSINLTPSHNPANWSGFKLNPRDGGPAGTEITSVIESEANRMMATGDAPATKAEVEKFETIDPVDLYEKFLRSRGTIDLDGIKEFLAGEDILVVVDHVHGASRGRPEKLLGKTPRIHTIRTEDDVLFGGVAPEPSGPNISPLMTRLQNAEGKFKIGALIDPDGDRVRFTDGVRDISMNHFGAMALHYLHKFKNIGGVLVKSVATSNFGNAIAEGMGIPVRETAVGFKNFRPYMLPLASERAIVAYEESDGITGFNHTLEKDAIFGLLLAIEMVAATGKNLSEYLAGLEEEFGAFYPERKGVSVDKSMAGPALGEKLGSALRRDFSPGKSVRIAGAELKIKDVITLDGTKVVLEDGSWFLIRPSGTEPKVRLYVESRDPAEGHAMLEAAEEIMRAALG